MTACSIYLPANFAAGIGRRGPVFQQKARPVWLLRCSLDVNVSDMSTNGMTFGASNCLCLFNFVENCLNNETGDR